MREQFLSKCGDDGWGYDAAAIVYDRDPEGIDLLCAHCGKLLFAAFPKRGDQKILKGAICSNCGGKNHAP